AIGLASMLGAGVFAVFRDAYNFAGAWLYAALALAAIVASLNAASVYQLARQIDRPGGTYAYARVYRGETWSFLAGFAFVFGKIGSIAAIALVFGEYAWPAQKQLAAVLAILVMVIVNVLGIQRTAEVAAVLSVITTGFLIFAISVGSSPLAGLPRQFATYTPTDLPTLPGWGIVTGASLIFFAFAGYARVATLGNEVRDAKKNIPKAVALSLGGVLIIYLLLTTMLTKVLGEQLATSEAPFIAYFNALGFHLDWLVLAVASVASLGSILALLAGVSRTAAEMSSDRELPKFFEARNRFGSPWVAEVVIAVGASALVFVGDLSSVIGFSSFSVLFYYAVAHLSVLGQPIEQRLLPRALPVVGLILCLLLAFSVPGPAVAVSTLILLAAVVARRFFRVEWK
ncbi:MAG: APC family permease, partial [Rhodoluna sp.]|nr:APC family permease [Rhodoluna sp.]